MHEPLTAEKSLTGCETFLSFRLGFGEILREWKVYAAAFSIRRKNKRKLKPEIVPYNFGNRLLWKWGMQVASQPEEGWC